MPSDEELMAAVARGDTQAFADLFHRYRQAVFGFCYRMLGDSTMAEDAVQDLFLRIFDRRKTYRTGARFTPWMYAIARNLCTDRLRSATHQELTMSQIDEDAIPDEQDAQQYLERAELASAVRDAISALPDEMRTAVILREYQGLDYREIAAAMNCSEEAVRVRMHRARQELGRRLRPFLQAMEG